MTIMEEIVILVGNLHTYCINLSRRCNSYTSTILCVENNLNSLFVNKKIMKDLKLSKNKNKCLI